MPKHNILETGFCLRLQVKSKLVQHAYAEGHKICWNEAKILQIEPNTTYRKYKEFAHMSLIDHPIS
jgi:DNA-binding transcriptional regulator YhcF (GntR family)